MITYIIDTETMTTEDNRKVDTSDSNMIWQRCASSFRRSKGDLIRNYYIDPAIQEHMTLPPIVATLDDEISPMAVHYFSACGDDESESDSEVECIVLPCSLPLVPLRRDHSSGGGMNVYHRRYSLE